jgi:preprotein translocase subunit SecE
MAIKEKNTQKQSKLLEVLTTEYKWENLLLGILATLSAALALIIIIGKGPLTISPEFPILGTGNNGLIFAWILFIISIFGLFLVIYPFFLPALPEIRKITWATKKQFLQDAARVIIFTLIVTGFIFAFDLIATQLIGLLGAN